MNNIDPLELKRILEKAQNPKIVVSKNTILLRLGGCSLNSEECWNLTGPTTKCFTKTKEI